MLLPFESVTTILTGIVQEELLRRKERLSNINHQQVLCTLCHVGFFSSPRAIFDNIGLEHKSVDILLFKLEKKGIGLTQDAKVTDRFLLLEFSGSFVAVSYPQERK